MFVTLVAVALMVSTENSALARCSIGTLRNNPEGYVWPLPRIRAFVADAELVVRAKATARLEKLSPSPFGTGVTAVVEFEIQEVLRGERSTAQLSIPGDTVAQDDFNQGAVPFRIVRRAGQHGDCFATTYKIGAEYLLLLRMQNGVLSPYWAPLAPLNEQVRGREDPWVKWVRDQIG